MLAREMIITIFELTKKCFNDIKQGFEMINGTVYVWELFVFENIVRFLSPCLGHIYICLGHYTHTYVYFARGGVAKILQCSQK